MRKADIANPPVFSLSEETRGRLTLTSDTGAVAHLFVLEPDLFRLMVLPDGALRHPRSWTVAPGADDVAYEGRDRFDLSGFSCPAYRLERGEGRLAVETDRLRVEAGLASLRCRWFVRQDEAWVEVARDRPTQAYDFGWWGGETVRHYLARTPGEQIFGLGERSGAMDRSGRRFRLQNIDPMGYDARTSDPLYKHIPFYIARKPKTGAAVGLFYDTLSDCAFDFGCEHSNYHGPYRSFEAEHGDLDLYVIAGPKIADITRRFTWLTGRPAATPDWALGYSGSTMSYTDAPDAQGQMGKFLTSLAEHDIPCTSFHFSSGYTSIGDKRYVFHWNRDKFPDPKAFVQSYAEAGVKLIANIKPALLLDHPQFEDAAKAGLLLADKDGAPVQEQFWDAPGCYVDFTRPEAKAWWKANVKRALLDVGIAATWNDNNEYEVRNPAALAHGFGHPFPAREMKPLHTLLMLQASREAQAEHAPDETPFLVSRSGAAGMQRYAQTWSGDNYTSWETLRWNIPMGLGLSLSGVSNIGHDIGGFAGPRPDAELFARWVGCGVFMPRFSIHSWNDDGTVNEPWMHLEVLDDVRRLMRFRERLVPYLAALLRRYRDDYEPVMRPVFYDFPEEDWTYDEQVDYMLGDAILVAPVVEQGETLRTVRLPKGADWRCGWSGEIHPGGSEVTVPAPYDQPPFFLRLNAKGGLPPGF